MTEKKEKHGVYLSGSEESIIQLDVIAQHFGNMSRSAATRYCIKEVYNKLIDKAAS